MHRNYQYESRRRKTIPVTFSCPAYLFNWLETKAGMKYGDKTKAIVKALEHLKASETDVHMKLRLRMMELKEAVIRLNELQEEVGRLKKDCKETDGDSMEDEQVVVVGTEG